eukprot:6486747-Pyramimonas_sp.AAC.1
MSIKELVSVLYAWRIVSDRGANRIGPGTGARGVNARCAVTFGDIEVTPGRPSTGNASPPPRSVWSFGWAQTASRRSTASGRGGTDR